MKIRENFGHTKNACYFAGIVQSMVCVFISLLVVIFNREYKIPLSHITVLLTVNFIVQFATDFAAIFFVDKVGARGCMVAAHGFIGVGFLALGILPSVMENVYWGIFFAVVLFSIGGGLLEVMMSPILDACPSKNKAAAMSMLHAMFSVGTIAMILISSLFFLIFGQENWRWLSFIWATLALINACYFMLVPIGKISSEDRISIKEMFKKREFLLFALIMMCGGASEIAMSQWASAFAESSLGISKTVGDILGPCMFAAMMAVARMTYPKIAEKVNLMNYIRNCSVLCVIAYLIAALSPFKIIALAGCGLCGLSVGIMWPGTISLASRMCGGCGAIFAMMALAGDIGCTVGPALVGFVSSAFDDNLKIGLLSVVIFPIILFTGMSVLRRKGYKYSE